MSLLYPQSHSNRIPRPGTGASTGSARQNAELCVAQAPIHADVPPGGVNGGDG